MVKKILAVMIVAVLLLAPLFLGFWLGNPSRLGKQEAKRRST